jgi:eukaryotic-like serine/threonine-protein kinase
MTRFNPYEKFLTVGDVKNLGLKWSYRTNGEVAGSPAVARGLVYVGSFDLNGIVYALDAHTGAQRWSFAVGGYVASSPAVANGLVYIGL